MDNNAFKSSLFGGFRRKDVIAYIERSAAESGERITALEQSGDKLSKENETLRGDLASVTGARDRLSDALADNFDKQEALKASLDAAEEELGDLRAQLSVVLAERDSLRSEVDSLRSQAEEYRSVKANLTELELAAHQRADGYEAEVRQRADDYEAETRGRADDYEAEVRRRVDDYDAETRRRLRDMVDGCRAQCDLVMETLGTTCQSLSAQLRDSDATISRLPDAFHTLRHDLDELGKLE